MNRRVDSRGQHIVYDTFGGAPEDESEVTLSESRVFVSAVVPNPFENNGHPTDPIDHKVALFGRAVSEVRDMRGIDPPMDTGDVVDLVGGDNGAGLYSCSQLSWRWFALSTGSQPRTGNTLGYAALELGSQGYAATITEIAFRRDVTQRPSYRHLMSILLRAVLQDVPAETCPAEGKVLIGSEAPSSIGRLVAEGFCLEFNHEAKGFTGELAKVRESVNAVLDEHAKKQSPQAVQS